MSSAPSKPSAARPPCRIPNVAKSPSETLSLELMESPPAEAFFLRGANLIWDTVVDPLMGLVPVLVFAAAQPADTGLLQELLAAGAQPDALWPGALGPLAVAAKNAALTAGGAPFLERAVRLLEAGARTEYGQLSLLHEVLGALPRDAPGAGRLVAAFRAARPAAPFWAPCRPAASWSAETRELARDAEWRGSAPCELPGLEGRRGFPVLESGALAVSQGLSEAADVLLAWPRGPLGPPPAGWTEDDEAWLSVFTGGPETEAWRGPFPDVPPAYPGHRAELVRAAAAACLPRVRALAAAGAAAEAARPVAEWVDPLAAAAAHAGGLASMAALLGAGLRPFLSHLPPAFEALGLRPAPAGGLPAGPAPAEEGAARVELLLAALGDRARGRALDWVRTLLRPMGARRCLPGREALFAEVEALLEARQAEPPAAGPPPRAPPA